MDLKLVKALVRIMKGGDVSELELEDTNAGTRIHLKRGPETAAGGHVVNVLPGAGSPAGMPYPGGLPYAAASELEPSEDELEEGLTAGTQEVLSPMVGTFYSAPSPEAENFVQVGSSITADSTVCIIEAMKVMNEIKAELAGEVVKILVESGEPVEHGQPLFLVKTS